MQGQADGPTHLLEELLARQRQRLGEGSHDEIRILWYLGEALAASGRIADATRVMKRLHVLHGLDLEHETESQLARLAEAAYLSLAGDLDGALAVLPSADFRPISMSLKTGVLFARLKGARWSSAPKEHHPPTTS